MIIDFHSHFIPGIDDGAKDEQMGLQMLKQSMAGGVTQIVATPHYYTFDNISVSDAIEKRDNALKRLEVYAREQGVELLPIYKGFEVHFTKPLLKLQNLDKLCIEGTNTLLVEMPYAGWDERTMEDFYSLTLKGFDLVIAHIDRYYMFNEKDIYKLLEFDVKFQVNAELFEVRRLKKFLKTLLESGRICIVGSDMHNLTDRAPNMEKAYEVAMKKFKQTAEDLFYNNALRMLSR